MTIDTKVLQMGKTGCLPAARVLPGWRCLPGLADPLRRRLPKISLVRLTLRTRRALQDVPGSIRLHSRGGSQVAIPTGWARKGDTETEGPAA